MCSAATISTVDSVGNLAQGTSITIGSDGLALISYRDMTNDDLKVAHCFDIECTAATSSTLDSMGFVGANNAITIGVDGFGLISYYDQTNGDLKVVHLSNIFGIPNVRYR
jgi:hypothetical protein